MFRRLEVFIWFPLDVYHFFLVCKIVWRTDFSCILFFNLGPSLQLYYGLSSTSFFFPFHFLCRAQGPLGLPLFTISISGSSSDRINVHSTSLLQPFIHHPISPSTHAHIICYINIYLLSYLCTSYFKLYHTEY